MWKVFYTKDFEKEILNVDIKIQKKVFDFVEELKVGIFLKKWDIKKLQGLDNQYRCRIGVYRLIYKINKKEITIFLLEIIQRKDAYK